MEGWCGRTQPILGGATPGLVSWIYNKSCLASPGEQTSKQHLSVVSASALPPRPCSAWVPVPTSFSDGLQCKQTIFYPSCFGCDAHHRNRNFNEVMHTHPLTYTYTRAQSHTNMQVNTHKTTSPRENASDILATRHFRTLSLCHFQGKHRKPT